MRWFTSDHHFGHYNVIRYCGRPFKTALEMDNHMIEMWNKVVKPDDEVWYLGDFSFLSKDISKRIFNKLNGTKHLVRGNHDKGNDRMVDIGFTKVYDSHKLALSNGQFVILSHYPYRNEGTNEEHSQRFKERRLIDKGSWLLCGHIHEKWRISKRMINVGVDQWDFTPVSEDQLIETIKDVMRNKDGQ